MLVSHPDLLKRAILQSLRILMRQKELCNSYNLNGKHGMLDYADCATLIGECLRLDLEELDDLSDPAQTPYYANYKVFLQTFIHGYESDVQAEQMLQCMCRTAQAERRVEQLRLIQWPSEPMRRIVSDYL